MNKYKVHQSYPKLPIFKVVLLKSDINEKHLTDFHFWKIILKFRILQSLVALLIILWGNERKTDFVTFFKYVSMIKIFQYF